MDLMHVKFVHFSTVITASISLRWLWLYPIPCWTPFVSFSWREWLLFLLWTGLLLLCWEQFLLGHCDHITCHYCFSLTMKLQLLENRHCFCVFNIWWWCYLWPGCFKWLLAIENQAINLIMKWFFKCICLLSKNVRIQTFVSLNLNLKDKLLLFDLMC